MDNLLPGSINTEDLKILEQVVEERLAAIPLGKLVIYIIETCDAEALPFLARQFNVLGNRGWRWADTEEKQRELLKRAIKMQRKEGTEFSVKESLKVIGINNAEILHPIPGNQYDGQWSFNGTITYGGAYHWACFKVLVDTEELANLEPDVIEIAVELINEWKNVRSRLIAVEAAAFIEDTVEITDELEFDLELTIDEQVGPITYNGAVNFDGSATYNGTYDDLYLEMENTPSVLNVNFLGGVTTEVRVTAAVSDTVNFMLDWGGQDSIIGTTSDSIDVDGYMFTTPASGDRTLRIRISDPSKVLELRVGSDDMFSIEFAAQMNNLQTVTIQDSQIESVLFNLFTVPGIIAFNMPNNKLPVFQVNSIIGWINTNHTVSGGQLSLGDQTPAAPPSGTGITAKNALIADGWTVTTD